MRMEVERRQLREENAALKFNQAHEIGTSVRFWTGVREGIPRLGVTWTTARLMGGSAGVYVRDAAGKNVGFVCLTHVEPYELFDLHPLTDGAA